MNGRVATTGVCVLAASLGACVLASRQAPPTLLRIQASHVILVLDQSTYDALTGDAIFQNLAATEQKATQAGEVSYSGFYVYGRTTYLELFGEAGKLKDANVGDISLGLSSVKQHEIDRLIDRLGSSDTTVHIGHRVRTTSTGEVPWYTFVELDDAGARKSMDVWANELEPSYLPSQYPDTHFNDPLSRVEYMKLKYKPNLPFLDVTGLHVTMSEHDAAPIRRLLKAAGWRVQESDRRFNAIGPNFTLTARLGTVTRLEAVELSFSKALPPRIVQFNACTLEVSGKKGTLICAP